MSRRRIALFLTALSMGSGLAGAQDPRVARAVHELGVPHPLHVHCNNLGLAGNFETGLTTIAAADDLPLHLAHMQFYSYGKEGERGFVVADFD